VAPWWSWYHKVPKQNYFIFFTGQGAEKAQGCPLVAEGCGALLRISSRSTTWPCTGACRSIGGSFVFMKYLSAHLPMGQTHCFLTTTIKKIKFFWNGGILFYVQCRGLEQGSKDLKVILRPGDMILSKMTPKEFQLEKSIILRGQNSSINLKQGPRILSSLV
jgi:hypothetical protein